ncbi:two-component system, OmpR family, sensor histidine kinase CpxA [Desulfuromusa kysingii]|uniref:histidine kinase n=1 Tax=Desulfuromusa kysingii TaxID=37625 RepID=A0A1H4DH78_9BACT|nr:ATP-binding protein [Desulfuromusa kysingii]SEA72115.1 two-component system, OmpR family, sensor histidine kinase CpxA [Desulfuromusa kysingii]
MRSLFLKIFLYFLLILFLVSTAVIVLTYFRDQEFPPLAHQDFAQKAMTEYGRKAIEAFENDGIEEVDKLTQKIFIHSGVHLLLSDSHGQPLSARRVPRRMQHMTQRALETGEVVFPMAGSRNGLASAVQSASGQTYFIALSLPDQPPSRDLVKGITHGFLGWRLLVLLAITAGVCYFLARSLTSPISRLRQATRKFAAGDLSVRIGNRVRGKNEISGLAHDFDEMAGKIEALVDTQKNLLRDISHELRSPLTRLGIALELARQQDHDMALAKPLNRIELESERMNTMIGQLLNLTRLENSANHEPFQNFDLQGLLADLVADANYEAKARHCKVTYEAPDAVVYCGSQTLLAQALENVIRNAVKYTADSSAVSVDLIETAEQIIIRVADQGSGVPEEALGKLFEPFYRVAAARDRQSGGTGIGLAIAERAIKLHSGNISAINLPTGGLLIEINLPVKK